MKKDNKKFNVSIALCTYNGEKFISEQLQSILNQTDKDFEIIIVDDMSTDNTVTVIKKFASNNSNIKLFINDVNLGFIKNFEKAISLCSGEYIFLSDQDDIWQENKIELFLKNINDNVLIYSDAILIDEFGKSLNKRLIHPRNLQKGNNNKVFIFDNCISGNTLMFKRELLKYILPIPNNISFHDVWIAFVASTFGKITYVNEPLTFYRRYENQVTHKKKKIYKNFLHRLKEKKEQQLKYSKKNLNNIKSFYKLEILKDESLIFLLKELILHFENYPYKFFNIKLFFLLHKNKDLLFAIEKKGRNKSIFKIACGLIFHKLTFYSV